MKFHTKNVWTTKAGKGAKARSAGYGMIHYDFYTRFGYGGARRPVEQFVRQLQAHEDWEWDESVRDLVEQVKRSCPVFLFG
jgi:hypothetical protein